MAYQDLQTLCTTSAVYIAYRVLEIARKIEEYQGDKELTLDLLKSLEDTFMDRYFGAMERDPYEP
jgi:hypothetical protein